MCKAALASLFVGLSLALMAGCGGGGGGGAAATTDGTISGAAVKGPVATAQVQAFAINANGTKGSTIGTAMTSSTGGFVMTVGSHAGPVMLEMTGGTFIDESSGTQMGFNGAAKMTAVIPFMTAGTTLTGVEITPLTSMAQTMAANMTGGMIQVNAATANTAVGRLYNVSDILQTTPMDPTIAGTGAIASTDQRNYGLCLAAMSQYAATSGLADTTVLVTGMMDDAADGIMNGVNGGVPVMLALHAGGSVAMAANAGSVGMATAMQTFMLSSMNNSGVTATSPGMQAFLDMMNSANGQMVGSMSGTAMKGPVAGAQVQAFAVNANGTKGTLIGTATTSAAGAFTMTVASHEGPVMLEMTGGTFIDEASGTQMSFSSTAMMTAVVPSMAVGATLTDIEITPLTSMAQTMAANMTGGMSQANAAAANTSVGSFYGVSDILQTKPMDPTVTGSGATATVDQRNYGICLAAMSQYAVTIGLSDTSALITAMMGDAADGFMNGMNGGTAMMMSGPHMMNGSMAMSANTGYAGMATAMQTYLNSATRNHSGITAAEMQTIMQQLSSSTGHIL